MTFVGGRPTRNEIAIIRDRNVFRIEAPPGTNIFNGDRALDVDFDIVSLNGEMFLAKDVLEMARTGAKGFRLVGFEPLPEE
jgi:hypothetical protein